MISQGSGSLSGVQGQGPSPAIKAQHGCLAKMDIGGQFGCSACRQRGKRAPVENRDEVTLVRPYTLDHMDQEQCIVLQPVRNKKSHLLHRRTNYWSSLLKLNLVSEAAAAEVGLWYLVAVIHVMNTPSCLCAQCVY